MSAKQEVRELLDRLPDDVELEDVIHHLYVRILVDAGLAAADAADTVPREEVIEELDAWMYGGPEELVRLRRSRS